jgi:tetratricopeptide (TPR) repeat protein
VIATASRPLGVGRELILTGLTEADLGIVVGESAPERRHAIWAASRGLPGTARAMVAQLTELPGDQDALVHLALHAPRRSEFLAVDDALVRLLEQALGRPTGDGTRARLLAGLARELLGDPLAGSRRRAVVDEALLLARRAGDDQVLAEVLDARLHALWDPAGVADRLGAAVEIVELARATGDDRRERSGLFWHFVALMELARVDEAELALASFERSARTSRDAEASAIALSRHAMLATLRGRYTEAIALIEQVADQGRRVGMPDVERLIAALHGDVVKDQGDESAWQVGLQTVEQAARRLPGHLYEATAARILLALGRGTEAATDLDRMLPSALAASGPRWLGAITDLSAVAAEVGDPAVVARLHEALLPYAGRLVVWGGANATNGPVSHYLGLLEMRLGQPDAAVAHLVEATSLAQRIGALPALAHGLAALADALELRADAGDPQRAAEARQRAGELSQRLEMTALERRLNRPGDEWALRRDGTDWLLEADEERARLPDSRGMQQLRALLAAPRSDIPALDLAAGGPGLRPTSAAPVLDAAAVASYRQRLRELDAELHAADAAGDTGRSRRAEDERQAVLGELRRSSSLGGRVRRTTTESERARVNVTRTLRAALDRITDQAPRAGWHLRASIRTGLYCRYDPAPGGPSGWQL